MSTPPSPAKTCPRCHNAFSCGIASGGCWCTKLWLPATVLAALRENYTDCLCRECLEQIAAGADPAPCKPAETSTRA